MIIVLYVKKCIRLLHFYDTMYLPIYNIQMNNINNFSFISGYIKLMYSDFSIKG